MAQLFTNNAATVLNGAITNVATTITLSAGTGALFPTPTGGDYFLATLVGLDGEGNEDSWEIVKVTARSTDALTVTRAQEGTAGVAWDSGTRIELRLTAAQVALFETAYGWGDHATPGYQTAAQVTASIDALIDSSPGTLDTLNELAAALGDDPNYAATITAALALKMADLIDDATPTLGGPLDGADKEVKKITVYDTGLKEYDHSSLVANANMDHEVAHKHILSLGADTLTLTLTNPAPSGATSAWLLRVSNASAYSFTIAMSGVTIDWGDAGAPTAKSEAVYCITFEGGATTAEAYEVWGKA